RFTCVHINLKMFFKLTKSHFRDCACDKNLLHKNRLLLLCENIHNIHLKCSIYLVLRYVYNYELNVSLGIKHTNFTISISSTGISLIKHWVQDSRPISKEDLIDHFHNLMNNGTASMIKK